MPVGRIILKSISDSNKLPKLKTDGARLLYTWLLTHLDINGCFSGDSQVIRGKVFTRLNKSNKTINNYLEDLELNKLIIRYKVDGDLFLNVPDFVEKQPSLNPKREGKSNIPLPTPELLQQYSVITPTQVKLSKVKLSKVKEEKNTYAEFVLMTPEEYQKLVNKYGEKNTEKFIEKLNNTKGANKKLVYTSYYYAILKLVVEAVVGEDKKKELEKDYQEGIQKEKEWKKTKKEEVYKHKPIPKNIKEQIHKVLNIPDRDKLNKLKGEK